jgi:hypothetical protein
MYKSAFKMYLVLFAITFMYQIDAAVDSTLLPPEPEDVLSFCKFLDKEYVLFYEPLFLSLHPSFPYKKDNRKEFRLKYPHLLKQASPKEPEPHM